MLQQPSNSATERPTSSTPKLRLANVYHKLVSGETTRKGLMSVIGQSALSVASLVTATYIGRVGGKEQLGLYALALSLVYMMRSVQGELVVAPYTIYWHRKHENELASYRGSAVLHQLILCGLTSLGLGIFLLSLACGFGTAELLPTIGVLVVVSPFILSRCFSRHMMFAHLHFGMSMLIDVTVAITQIAALLIVGYLGALTAPAAFLVLGAVSAIATLAWYIATPHAIQFQFSQAGKDWCENWKFAKWALASSLVGCSTPYILPWVLSASHGIAETGYYAAGATLIGLTQIYVIGIANLITPRATQTFVDQGPVQLRRFLAQACPILALPIFAFAGLLCLTGDFLPSICFGNEYSDLGIICSILAISSAINAVSIIAGNGFWAIDRPKDNLWADATVLVTTFIAAALLAIPYGAFGAAAATLIGVSCGTLVRGVMLLRTLGRIDSTDKKARAS